MEKNGDFFPVKLGHKTFYFVCSPEIAGEFLCHRADNYLKSRLIFNKIRPITGKKVLVQLEGEYWEEIRHVTNQQFYQRSLEQIIPILNANVQAMENNLLANQKTGAINLSSYFVEYTLNTIMQIVTGMKVNSAIDQISESFITLNDLCGQCLRSLVPLPLWIPSPRNLKITAKRNYLREKIKKEMFSVSNKLDENCLLGKLGLNKKKFVSKNQLTMIIDQVMTFASTRI